MKGVVLLVASALLLAACGDDGSSESQSPATNSAEEAQPAEEDSAADSQEGPKGGGGDDGGQGTTIVAGDSEFGEMLYDAEDQAIYIFENDSEGESVCNDECAEAWPPVLTEGDPVAAEGVDESLLGTIERSEGTTQVTYADQPLYYYAHEAPGEVRCHNVNLNGGFWWVVGPDGERLA